MPTDDRPVFTAHDPSDLINLLPAAFGFVPQESLCVLATYGPRHRMGFRMRLDLQEQVPPDEVAGLVHHHLTRQRAEGAIIVVVSQRTDLAERVARAVEEGLGTIVPVVAVWATDEQYWTTHPDLAVEGRPYERSLHHVAVVEAVAEGVEILGSREELLVRVAQEQGARRRWLDVAADEHAEQVASLIMRAPGGDVVEAARRDVVPLLDRARAGESLTEGEVLRVAVWTISIAVRDDLIAQITREDAETMRALWQRAARLAPDPLRAPVLCVAGFAAHRCGDGAQALVAAEAAVRADPRYSLAGILLRIVESGLSPDEVSAVWRGEHRRAG